MNDPDIAAQFEFRSYDGKGRNVTESVAWNPVGESLDEFRARVDASMTRIFEELQQRKIK